MTKPRDARAKHSPFLMELLFCVVAGVCFGLNPPPQSALDQPYVMESVYKVKAGHAEEYLQLLKTHEFKILDHQKALGDVLSYTVYQPRLHADEDKRWDYRVVIVYRNQQVPAQSSSIEKQLFTDRATFGREESYRRELTDAHWELPLGEIDPRA